VGNILFHLQFPAPEIAPVFTFDSFFDSVDGFSTLKVGSGSLSWIDGGLRIASGTTPSSYQQLKKKSLYTYQALTFDKKRTLQVECLIRHDNDPNSTVFICTGLWGGSGGAFGFRFTDTKIRGFSKSGWNVSYKDLEVGKTPPWTATKDLKAILTPGVRVDFYIGDVLIDNVTTYIPAGTTGAYDILEAYTMNATILNHYIELSRVKITQDL